MTSYFRVQLHPICSVHLLTLCVYLCAERFGAPVLFLDSFAFATLFLPRVGDVTASSGRFLSLPAATCFLSHFRFNKLIINRDSGRASSCEEVAKFGFLLEVL